ncbi:hypothetical protein [Aureimonas sp. SK2]|uniref:hypothetical protein n=1 Tax=Aureimonas sp. SK2 TaxID=3015992 RepID=UPI002444921A|nr:hypothetical protein [Aureimonas sp. SK2]
MASDIVSRWENNKSERKSERKRLALISLLVVCPLILGGAVIANYVSGAVETYDPIQTNSIASELRAALTPSPKPSNDELQNALAVFAQRLDVVEAENKRLKEEMDGLLNHDGVIQKLATHIRALHAQNEATRRDVVGALTQPVEEDPASEFPIEPDASGVYGEETQQPQLLTRAKHTVVTPAAVTEAPAPEKAAPAKKPAKVDPEEGATN